MFQSLFSDFRLMSHQNRLAQPDVLGERVSTVQVLTVTRTIDEGYAPDMTHQQKIVRALLDKHAQKASESEYDRSVAISAISASREIIQAVPTDLNGKEYAACVLSELEKLLAGYHDPDGEYTSGKGVIGALLDDLQCAL